MATIANRSVKLFSLAANGTQFTPWKAAGVLNTITEQKRLMSAGKPFKSY